MINVYQVMKLTKTQRDVLRESVQVLGLPARVVNALESKKEVLYVYQLLQLTKDELEEMPNFGNKTVDIIFRSLSRFGFKRQKKRGT